MQKVNLVQGAEQLYWEDKPFANETIREQSEAATCVTGGLGARLSRRRPTTWNLK